MWSDNESTIDLLNVRHLVSAVEGLVTAAQLTPVTIGVFGDWGSGKSSIVRMVERQLAPRDDVLCVYFNGWRFEGYEDAKTALMSTILDAVAEERGLSAKALELLKRLGRRVDWLRLGRVAVHLKLAALTGGVSVPLSVATELAGAQAHKSAAAGAQEGDTAGEAGENLELDRLLREAGERGRSLHRTVRDFEEDFAKLLEATAIKRLVVVIDDLDRCLPDRVIETLEAIRLFLAVPGTAFVISADERLVQHAVKLRFPAMESVKLNVGRDYLEKMIQIPVRVPPLSPQDVGTYLALLFAQLDLQPAAFERLVATLHDSPAPGSGGMPTFGAQNASALLGRDLTATLVEDLGLAARIAHVVSLSVDGNPRQVKRFLNAHRLRLTMAAARGVSLAPRLAAKLMLLEYFRPEAFRTLGRWQSAQGGRPDELRALEAHRSASGEPGEQPPRSERPSASGDARSPRGTRDERGRRPDRLTAAAAPGGAAHGEGTRRRGGAGADAVTTPELSPEAHAWLGDPWLLAWLDTEPALGGEDLTRYYSFATERLFLRAPAAQRMSATAQEIFGLFLSEAASVRAAAGRRARDLLAPDALALHEALSERVRLVDDPEAPPSPLAALFELVAHRPELGAELVALLRSLSVASLGPGVPPKLLGSVSGSPAEDAARALVREWAAQQDNPLLAASARTMVDSAARAPGGRRP